MVFSKSKLSLRIILAITFFLLVVVALFVSITLLLISYSDTVRASIISKQEAVAQKAATTVSSFISERINTIQAISRMEDLSEKKRAQLLEFTNSLLGSDPAYRQIFIMGKNGEDLARAARIPLYTAETITNIYETELLEATSVNSIGYSEVYIDEESNEPLILISIPVLNIYSELIRFLFLEINLKFMWEVMQNLRIGETGYAYVVDNEGYLVAYKDSSRILVHENLSRILTVKNFIENSDAQQNEAISYKGLLNENVIGVYVPLNELQWAVIVEMPLTEADEPVYNNLLYSLLITLIIALLAGGFGIFIANYLVHPLIDLTNTATRISQGELELKAKVTGTKEVALLASVFNASNGVLTEIISKARELTNNLNASTIQIQSATEEQTSASSQIASSVTEISATMEELSITAKQITNNVGDLVLSSQDTAKLLQKIEKQLKLITDQLSEVSGISQKNTEEIEELGKRSIIINEMVELIKDVASKTNILSINASIEASRQDSADSGFMVVAAEIRSLSKETIESAKKAEQAGQDIQEFLNSIIVSSARESDKVTQSSEISKGIFEDIEKIIKKIEQNYDSTQKIDVSIKQQERGSAEAAETMRQMSEVTRQSAQSSRLILNAIKEILDLNEKLKQVVNRRS